MVALDVEMNMRCALSRWVSRIRTGLDRLEAIASLAVSFDDAVALKVRVLTSVVTERAPTSPINVALNWTAEVKK